MTPLKGTIFEVKRFAVHDGPGVRTTLFLKGCPLRCRWCHNPEGMKAEPQLAYYPQKCVHCGECVAVCPHRAQVLTEGRHVLERARCVACGRCAAACLGRALKCVGREITVDEARDIVLEDRDFYADGGGVTLSGGEPLLQPEFCAELSRLLKRDGIGCALDTSGAVPWDRFERVLPFIDVVLYDVKHVDDGRHRTWVGASNGIILRNLESLSERNVPTEIRVPLIPGFNLDAESVYAIGHFLSGLKHIPAVRLLPFHPARSKFGAVGTASPMPDVEPPSAWDVRTAADMMAGFGLSVVCPDTEHGRGQSSRGPQLE